MVSTRWTQFGGARCAAITMTLTITMAWGCSGTQTGSDGAVVSDATASGEDACRYLTPSDVEPYTGPLVSPPYRAGSNDGVPNPSGDACMYRGKDGREILFQHSAHGGKVAGTVARRVPAVMDRLLQNGAGGIQNGNADGAGPAAAIMGSAGPGPWDNSNWFPTGSLMVYKNDDALIVDVSAANGGKEGALDLARKAIARLPQPLDYDGAKAVALAPKPVTPIPPCDLVPRARAEAILGPLASNPVADSDGMKCTYKVTTPDGDVDYAMGITWTGGYGGLSRMKHGMSTVMGLMGPAQGAFKVGNGPMPDMSKVSAMPDIPKLDPQQQKMLEGFTKMVGVPGMAGAVSRGLKTDTTLAGPWDAAALVNGSWLMVTKHDVGLVMILGTADYDKAKALMAAACERL